jgi:hypothetical protein
MPGKAPENQIFESDAILVGREMRRLRRALSPDERSRAGVAAAISHVLKQVALTLELARAVEPRRCNRLIAPRSELPAKGHIHHGK